MARFPVAAAPSTMLIAANSLSDCRKTRPSGGKRTAMPPMISFCGVIGYPK